MKLSLLHGTYAICRLASDDPLPEWLPADGLVSVTRTSDELSIVCGDTAVPDGIRSETGWRALMVEGPLDFSLTGVLASLAGALAEADVSLFALSTYDTDYLLVRESQLPSALDALAASGHSLV